MSAVRLSIIVPVLNEAANLPPLLADLARQQGVAVELLLCDGGSGDDSAQLAVDLFSSLPFSARWLDAPRGRGAQMNAGAEAARGEYLLFLHADCRFPAADALAAGLAALESAGPRAAGHFALRFARSDATPSFPYYFYECKARLNRPGCIHGDQGFLLRRDFFHELGGFDAQLPLLEDDQLALRVVQQGRWLLLPAEIVTSARRFEVEGLYERQVLSAIITNFFAIGWSPFCAAAGSFYRSQDRTRRLHLGAVLAEIDALLESLSWRARLRLWLATGGYVRPQAWQLALLLDLRRNFRRGLAAGSGPLTCLARHDRWFDLLTDHAVGRLVATLLTWCWFRLLRLRHRPPPPSPCHGGDASPNSRPCKEPVMQPATFERINAIPLLVTLGIVITDSGPRHAVMEVTVDERHLNYFGGAHGGLLSTLADTVCFFPAPLLPAGRKVTTANLNVNYVRAAALGEHLVARSEIVHLGRRTVSLTMQIHSGEVLVAHGTATLAVLAEPDGVGGE